MTSYLFYYREYMKNAAAAAFENEEAALVAGEALPRAWSGHAISSENDLREYSSKFLVDAFNALGGTPVARFASLKVGRRRLFMKIVDDPKSDPPRETAADPQQDAPAPPQADAGAPTAPAEGVEGEGEMTAKKKAKAPRKAPRKAREKNGAMNKTEERALEMISRARGATLEEIMKDMALTTGTARNAVGRARRKSGKNIVMSKVSDDRKAYVIG